MDQQRQELPKGDAPVMAVRERIRLVEAAKIRSLGEPNSLSIARSTSRCPPYAAGSMSQPLPSASREELPLHRSP